MLASFLERYGSRLSDLERRIGYTFSNKALLFEALVHRSFAAEEGLSFDNERLEFLGDAFINFVIGFDIFKREPESTEGELTKKRSQLVREEALAWAARSIGLGDFLFLGKGEEKQGGRDRDSNLADAFEALVGAILVDGGIVRARSFLRKVLIKGKVPVFEDYKTKLFELCRERSYPLPVCVSKKEGSAVRVEIKVNGFRAVIFGSTKREAERIAAEVVYKRMCGALASC